MLFLLIGYDANIETSTWIKKCFPRKFQILFSQALAAGYALWGTSSRLPQLLRFLCPQKKEPKLLLIFDVSLPL